MKIQTGGKTKAKRLEGPIPKQSLFGFIRCVLLGRHAKEVYVSREWEILKVRCKDCWKMYEWSYPIWCGTVIEQWRDA